MRRKYYPHLSHAEGEEREDHKYVARVETGNPKYPWRYFYSWPAYNAYLKVQTAKTRQAQLAPKPAAEVKTQEKPKENFWSKLKNGVTSIFDKVESGIKSVGNTLEKIGSEPKIKVDAPSMAKNFVNNIVNGFLGKQTITNMSPQPTPKVEPQPTPQPTPQEEQEQFPELDKKEGEWTKDEDQAAVNPNYETGDYAYTNNCAWCTAAYELRQRGYDVEAEGITPDVYNNIYEIMSWYDVTVDDLWAARWDESQMNLVADQVEEAMVNEGEGSRGQFCIYWDEQYGGGGHSVVWEVENGEAKLRDCQTNQTVELEDYMQYGYEVYFFRTDNVELTDDILDAVKNRKD